MKTFKGHRTVIVSTHDLLEAFQCADRVCMMSNGKIVALDTPIALKVKYGVGYNLIIDSSLGRDQFDQIISTSHIDNVMFNEDLSTETKFVYTIPSATSNSLIANLLKKIESID